MSIASKPVKPRRWRLAALLAICVCTVAAAQETPPRIVIPDGTEIRLRLAQPLSAQGLLLVGKSARERSPVRLVVAADLRISGRLVIARGAIAQATITNVIETGKNSTETGIQMKLDWVASVNGVEVPVRAAKDGVRGPFMLQVIGVPSGALARPSRTHSLVSTVLTLGLNTVHDRNAAPAGTRMFAFVEGDVPLDAAEVEQAQARFPALNPHALLSIYRLKGDADVRSAIACDGKPAGEIGERQYVTLELPAGQHTLSVRGIKPLQINVAAGEEYYVRLRSPRLNVWELKIVDLLEGEDGVAAAELVQKQ